MFTLLLILLAAVRATADVAVNADGTITPSPIFTRAATATRARDHFRTHGFAHIPAAVDTATLDALRGALAHARAETGAASHGGGATPGPSLKFGLDARAFRAGGINDYVVASPLGDAARDATFWRALRRLAGAFLFGRPSRGNRGITVAERHFKVYGDDVDPVWGAHKDRFGSELVVGIVLRKRGARSRFAVCAEAMRERGAASPLVANQHASSAALARFVGSRWHPVQAMHHETCVKAAAAAAAAADAAGAPNAVPESAPPMFFVDDRPGDLVVFRGNVLDHGRWHAAGTSLLYIKLNGFGDNALGEDPGRDGAGGFGRGNRVDENALARSFARARVRVAPVAAAALARANPGRGPAKIRISVADAGGDGDAARRDHFIVRVDHPRQERAWRKQKKQTAGEMVAPPFFFELSQPVRDFFFDKAGTPRNDGDADDGHRVLATAAATAFDRSKEARRARMLDSGGGYDLEDLERSVFRRELLGTLVAFERLGLVRITRLGWKHRVFEED